MSSTHMMYMYTDIRAECMLEIERAYAVNLNTTRTCTVLGDLDQRCATRMSIISGLCRVALASMCTDFMLYMPCSVMLWAMHSLCNIHCYVNALPDSLLVCSTLSLSLMYSQKLTERKASRWHSLSRKTKLCGIKY